MLIKLKSLTFVFNTTLTYKYEMHDTINLDDQIIQLKSFIFISIVIIMLSKTDLGYGPQ